MTEHDAGMFPALKSERLTLKPGSLDYTEALLAIWRLPAVRRFLFDDEIMERSIAVDWITDMEGLHNRSLGI